MANPHPLPSPETQITDAQDHCDPEDKFSPLVQLKRMQRVLFKRTQSPDIEDKVLPAFACAWERLEERKRVLTMTPAPKPVEVKQKRRSSADAGPISPDLPARKPRKQAPSDPGTAPTT